VEPLKDAEEFVVVSHVEAGAAVPHAIDVLRPFGSPPDLDQGGLAGELDRIGEEIGLERICLTRVRSP
jgi:hypothetical protein